MRSPGASSTTRIGALLPSVLRQVERGHRPLFLIQRGWGRLVGKALAGHTQPVSLRRGRLVVLADRPGDSFTLSFQRERLLERIQRTSGCRGQVRELVIRPGDGVRH